jgi:fumarylacetoacetase
MLAHHTVGGCPFNVGDLMGSGTISSKKREGFGALLEITDNGTLPIEIEGEKMTFLEDEDTVTFTGVCGDDEENLVGFGQCMGTIKSALQFDF